MDEEISLRELIEILLAGKWLIIAITVLAILISGVVTFCFIEPTYEAKTVLAVNQTRKTENSEAGLEGLVDSLSGFPQTSIQSYVSQAKSAAVLVRVMERVGIPDNTSLGTFANKINISNIKDTELLEITVKDNSPEKAVEIADALAQELVVFVTDSNKLRTQKTLAFLEKQVEEEQTRLDNSVAEMKEFLKQPESVTELESRLQTNLALLSEFQTREGVTEVELKKVSATIASLENQLSEIQEKVELKKKLFDDPALYQYYTEILGKAEDTTISGIELWTEEINPVYMELKNQLEINKAFYAELEAEKDTIKAKIAQISEDINELQVLLAEKKTQLDQLQREMDRAKQNYTMFNNKYTEAQITESMKIGEAALTVVSPAYEPTVPVAPKKALNLAVAACLGLMLGVFVVLFKAYWASSAVDRKQVF